MKSNSISQAAQAFMLVAALFFSGLATAESSLQEINQTLKSGDIAKADRLMQEVVSAHPDSAKAHFKYAEILAAEGQMDKARAELSTAESLHPSLDFAKPAAVAALKQKVSGNGGYHTTNPVIVWAVVAFVVIFLIFIVRTLFRRPQAQPYYATNPQTPNAYGQQSTYPNNGYGPQGGGLGSNIASGLATGAAMGAGIVAGEMLMHKILDDDQPSSHDDAYSRNQPAPNNYDDISGNDFVDNNSSWDSDSSGSDFSSGDDSGGDWS